MRPSVLLVAIPVVLTATASAGPRGGTNGGGRLGQVAGGISSATAPEPRSTGQGQDRDTTWRERSASGAMYRRVWRNCPSDIAPQSNFGPNAPPATSPGASWCRGRYIAVINSEGTVVREYQPTAPPSAGTANVDFFVGAQKVVESDGAISLALSVDDRWFRLAGTLTRYHEEQMDGSTLTMTMPTLLGGVRLDGGGRTRAYVEGGVAVASTRNGPLADSSITGAVVGVHAEHRLTPSGSRAVVGDAHAMYFESDVKAYSARLGVRVGVLEAAFRILDFSVGPALYGPEVGLRF